MNPIKSVRSFLNKHFTNRILVALSGGADSVCLLYALKECGVDICAFHLNHGIRGAEADRDEQFCRTLCESIGVPFSSKKADIPAVAYATGKGIEETARTIRYEELEKEANRVNADHIATAHNADDNTETVIFNLVRGCSPDGLSGIPRIRGKIVRPLLDSTREEIEQYLSENGIAFVTDSTNSDINYTRNKIRHLVMPVLRTINPSVSDVVAQTCELLRNDSSYFKAALEEEKNTLPAELPRSVLTRQIAKRFSEKNNASLEYVHINEIADFVQKRACVTLDLPARMCVYISYGDYTFAKRAEKAEYYKKISYGITEIPEIGAKVFYGNENVYNLSTSVSIDCDKIVGGLYARPREAGDRIRVYGVTKNVRKELINKKIPLCVRNTLPVICDDNGIVYVPYIGADDRVFSNSERFTLGLLCSETETDNEK